MVIFHDTKKPLTQEEQEYFEKQTGLKRYQPTDPPQWTNPYSVEYWSANAVIAAVALLGRYRMRKVGGPVQVFTYPILGIPLFFFAEQRWINSPYKTGYERRRTFEEKLEFYPITRRAWNRAKAIHEAELESKAMTE